MHCSTGARACAVPVLCRCELVYLPRARVSHYATATFGVHFWVSSLTPWLRHHRPIIVFSWLAQPRSAVLQLRCTTCREALALYAHDTRHRTVLLSMPLAVLLFLPALHDRTPSSPSHRLPQTLHCPSDCAQYQWPSTDDLISRSTAGWAHFALYRRPFAVYPPTSHYCACLTPTHLTLSGLALLCTPPAVLPLIWMPSLP